MKMTFEEYCEDILDQHVALMSEDAIAEARATYQKLVAPQPKTEKHPDLKLPLTDLRARCERLVAGQKISIERTSDKDAIAAARVAVEFGEKLLAGRATKAQFVEHKEMNSQASRMMNDAIKKTRGV